MTIHNLKNNNSMKTQNTNKLAFAKNSVVELNDDQLNTVNGGSITVTLIVTVSILAATYLEA